MHATGQEVLHEAVSLLAKFGDFLPQPQQINMGIQRQARNKRLESWLG